MAVRVSSCELARSTEDCVEHGLGEAAGERVLLARVIAAQHRGPGVGDLDPVPELGPRRRERRPGIREHPGDRVVREPRRARRSPAPWSSSASSRVRYGRQRSRSSVVGLLAGGAHRTAAATYASRSSRPSSRATDDGWFARPGAVHRPEQPVAGTVAGEDAPGAVAAVRRRREPGDEHCSPGITEPGYRPPPVRLVAECGPLVPCDRFAPLDEARARATTDDLVGERVESRDILQSHARIVRPIGFAAVRLVLVVNPAASSYSEHARREVERRLGAEHDLVVVETLKRGHATELAERAARDGADAVAVLAGDGTLNEAAAGLAGTDTALAPLPGGSTNVFARTIGVAYDPAEAADALLASLTARSFRRIGLGNANGRYFLFHLGAGFDAAVVSEVEQRPEVKRYLAHPAFAVAAVDTWVRRYDRRTRIRATMLHDDGATTLLGEGPYAIVSNSDPYTYVARPRDPRRPASRARSPARAHAHAHTARRR